MTPDTPGEADRQTPEEPAQPDRVAVGPGEGARDHRGRPVALPDVTPKADDEELPPWSKRPERRRSSWLARFRRVLFLSASLYFFIFALMLMKAGAGGLEPLIRQHLQVDSVANSVGFGWLFAYAVMSGSPVAAAALTLLDRGLMDATQAFGMITGSRLGASFIVLVLGFIYSLRGHERRTSLSVGILSLVVTATLQIAALVIGVAAFRQGWMPPIEVAGGAAVTSVTDRLVGDLATTSAAFIDGFGGSGLVFLAGLGVILGSFSLFDRGLPPLRLERTPFGDISRLLYRPIVMFGLGMGVTVISMSVSVSLSLLVPLSARGYIRRENLIPYIMGANITTFIDTLLAALLLTNPMGFTIVLLQMVSATGTAILILVLGLHSYENAMLRIVTWTTASNRNLSIFMAVIFIIPITLLFL